MNILIYDNDEKSKKQLVYNLKLHNSEDSITYLPS